MGIDLLLESHSNALKGDVVMGGPDASGSDEVGVLGRKESHFFGDDLLDVRDDCYALHGHAELPQRSRKKGAVGVHRVALRETRSKMAVRDHDLNDDFTVLLDQIQTFGGGGGDDIMTLDFQRLVTIMSCNRINGELFRIQEQLSDSLL